MLSASFSAASIDPSVASALSANGSVRVIVLLKNTKSSSSNGGRLVAAAELPVHALDALDGVNVTRHYSSLPLLAATVDSNGLSRLQSDPNVGGVYYDYPVHAMDATSNAQIHADSVQNFVFNGKNVTGRNQTICIIDTGIDYRNPAFGTCGGVGVGAGCRVVGGYNFVAGTTDPLDDNKHGTHVAGIAGANGSGLVGVAPGANFVAIKVLDSSGSGSESNVLAGVDWCTNNRTLYNITAISMSLGDSSAASSPCDSSFVPDSTSINNSVNAGLFVSVASGNSGSKTGISDPACISNAVPVGSVDSSDTAQSFSQDWPNYLLYAPGVLVNSTTLNNNTQKLSGTSMSTPHVAGVVALMQDFAQRANGTLASVSYLRTLLNRTGVAVTDSSSGRTHYRIDALASLKAFQADVTPRTIALQSFANGSATAVNYSFVNVSFFDDNLTPSACILQWSNGTLTNFSMASASGSCSVNVTGQSSGSNSMTVYINDSFSNVGSAFFTQSFDVQSPQNVSSSFLNNSIWANASVLINVSFSDPFPDSCILQLDNANVTLPASSGSCLFNRTVSEGNHNFTAYANNSVGRLNQSGFFFFTTDLTPPKALVLVSPAGNNSFISVNYTFVNLTFTELHPANCTLQYTNATGTTNYSMALFGSNGVNPYCSFNVTSNFTNPAGQTHPFSVFVNDTAGNINSTGVFSITFDSVKPSGFTLIAPAGNNSFTALNFTFVNFSFVENNPNNCILQYGNATDVANYSMVRSGSSCWFNVTSNFTNPAGQTHNFTLWANDSAGNINSSGVFFITHESTPPGSLAYVLPTPVNGSFSNANSVLANVSFTEAFPSACVLQFSNATGLANFSMVLSGSGSARSCQFNVTGLGEGPQNFSVFVNGSSGLSSVSSLRVTTLERTAPSIAAVAVNPRIVNRTAPFNVSVNASDGFSPVLNVSVAFVNGSGSVLWSQNASLSGALNYTFFFANVGSLADGNYTLNVTAVDNASNAASNASAVLVLNGTPPTAPVLAAQANASGFVFLNWSASISAVGIGHYDLFRNGSKTNSTSGLNFSDASVVSGYQYHYALTVLDVAGNFNQSIAVDAFPNDSIFPLQTANVTASNLANGSVNVSWQNVTTDVLGQAELNVSFNVYRAANASSTNVSNMTFLATVSALSYEDDAVLTANATYLYVVASVDANGNLNATVFANDSANQTTVSSCSNAFSDFSSCSGGSQSRTRMCLGLIQTQSQSCSSSGGGSGGSGSGGAGGGGGVGGGSSGGSAGGSSSPSSGGAPGGGGGGGGPSDQLFMVQNIPDSVKLEPGKPSTLDATVSSFYTGYLRVNSVSISGVPSAWYDVPDLNLVTPISKTNFSIQWHPPADARGNYSVRLDIIGVGTKNAGLLNTSFNFTLVLPPAHSVQSSGGSDSGVRPEQRFIPTPSAVLIPQPAQANPDQGLWVGLLILAVGSVFIGYSRWKNSHAELRIDPPDGRNALGGKTLPSENSTRALPVLDDRAEKGVELPKKNK